MKSLILYVVISFATLLSSEAQSLNLNELIALRGKDAEEVNSYLSAKGWVFNDASEETEDQYSVGSWAFGKQLYSDRAKSFFKFMSAEGYRNKVSYITIHKSSYDLIKTKIIALKMKKISTIAKDGRLVTVYVGTNYIVETSLATDEQSSVPIYGISISKKPVQAGLSEYNISEEERGTEEETGVIVDSQQRSEEVLQPNQIEGYKMLVNGQQITAPPAEYVMFKDEVKRGTNLVSDASNPLSVIYRLDADEEVYVLSRLLDEDHEYYLVYVEGYYGYIKNSALKKYSI